jgi:hypothetical protein
MFIAVLQTDMAKPHMEKETRTRRHCLLFKYMVLEKRKDNRWIGCKLGAFPVEYLWQLAVIDALICQRLLPC